MKAIQKVQLAVAFLFIGLSVSAQKTRGFTVSRDINLSADQVWAVVGEDFGAIANSHPKIVSSQYEQGTLTFGEGAERVCYFDDEKKKYVKEKQIDFDADNYTFTVQMYHVDKIPLDPEKTRATYTVIPIDDNTSRLEFKMQFVTDPAFFGALAKGKFEKGIKDYMIAVEHHAKTGEVVNQENFNSIKKQYK